MGCTVIRLCRSTKPTRHAIAIFDTQPDTATTTDQSLRSSYSCNI
jgi:hypothetical protein